MLGPVLARIPGWVIDLRSASYIALAPVPGALTVHVLSEDGRTVSHHNKSHKGQLARLLATAPREPSDADAVIRIARRGGLHLRRTSEHTLELATHDTPTPSIPLKNITSRVGRSLTS